MSKETQVPPPLTPKPRRPNFFDDAVFTKRITSNGEKYICTGYAGTDKGGMEFFYAIRESYNGRWPAEVYLVPRTQKPGTPK